MTKSIAVFLTSSLLLVLLGFVSCTKEESQPTMADRITGKWKKVHFATDDNGNSNIDDWEIYPVVQESTNILEFKKGGKGIEYTTGSPDLGFSWFITDELALAFYYDNSDTILYKVAKVNSANLEVTTKTKLGLIGYFYDKTR